ADDCELMAEALAQIDPSISCITACDGREALKMLHATRILPDTVFLDVNMPVMDGRECLCEIKKDPRLKNIPVVIYSTTANAAERRELYRLGAFGFMRKASTFRELVDRLGAVIEQLKYERSLPVY